MAPAAACDGDGGGWRTEVVSGSLSVPAQQVRVADDRGVGAGHSPGALVAERDQPFG